MTEDQPKPEPPTSPEGLAVALKPRRARRRRRTPVGASPGTLIADPSAARSVILFMGYGPEGLEEGTLKDVNEIAALRGRFPVLWVDVVGLGDLALIERLGTLFGLQRLALEDVVNTHERPKAEEYDGYLFVVTTMMVTPEPPATEQFAMFVGEDYVLSFQERHSDVLEAVRERIRRGRGQIRGQKPDYLAYALVDAIVDGYFPVLERHGERLEALEDRVVSRPEARQVAEIHELKRDLLTLRRAIWPQREMINSLARGDFRHVSETTRLYLRDCYDHTIQLMDLMETYREIASGLVDVYLSSQSARMNDIMKVLTIIATIFMPLGFVASLYGMNFDTTSPWNMPELGWRFGYFFALGVMAAIAGGLLYYFHRRHWIGRRREPKKPDD